MEFIFEILFEILAEFFGVIISEIVSATVHYIDARSKVKKIIKYIINYSILGLSILLITLSLIYNKKLFVLIAVSYLLIVVLLNLFNSLNKDIFKKKSIRIFIDIFKRIIHYAYPIILIVCGSIFLVDRKAKASIIILSVLAIIVWFSIDMYKVWKYNLRKAENNKIKHLKYYQDYMDDYSTFKYPDGLEKVFKGKSVYKQLKHLRVTNLYSATFLTSLNGLDDKKAGLIRIEEHPRIDGLIIRKGKIIGIKVKAYLGLEDCLIGNGVIVNKVYEDDGNGSFIRKDEYLYLVSFNEEVDDGKK